MPTRTLTSGKGFYKYHARSPALCKSFATITLSGRKGIKATICSTSRKPYVKSSRIINVLLDKNQYTRAEALKVGRRIAQHRKVM